MRNKILSICLITFFATKLLAQTPNKMSYQAVIRNSSNALVSNSAIGMRIQILQGSIFGAAVYVETQTPITNANGLVSIEIGGGTIVSGNFSTINWANGPYFIKIETDPSGGTNYTISGTSQLISVPYALHAKTADKITGGIIESDPIFNSSLAKNISASDTNRWNNKLSSYTETDPIFNTSLAKNISEIDTNRWNNKLSSYTESDPIFNTSLAKNISSTDTSRWNNKQNQLIPGSNISISGNTINAIGFTHYIGEHFGGGVIFHLWRDSLGIEHGLIVSKTNVSNSQAWSNVSSLLVGPGAQSSWDGLSNSNAIIAQGGHTSSAAKLCLDLVAGGQSDWYLPAIDELSLLWHNRFNVNKTISSINGAMVLPLSSYYWSSTENTTDNSFILDFANGGPLTQAMGFKWINYNVRAIRSF